MNEETRQIITRVFEMRDLVFSEDQEGVVEGYAAVFNQRTNIADFFYEVIAPGAFTRDALKDVAFLVNHDHTKIALARSRNNNRNSTLQLEEDQKGLKFTAQLDIENNADSKTLYSALKRGDVNAMSFSFRVSKEEWDDLDKDMPTRKIIEFARIPEISPVNFPAYSGTNISARQESDTLDSEKKALESARSQMLDSTSGVELEREKAKFFAEVVHKIS